ncbi:unnamed protein product [Prunus armeniaca]|uniref:FAD-binding domain-containing protein n=1 Tax=Prunus armeniaca TaxID=36596 RepID=A0A6J5XSR2_PRUAR|nr:unnamed protein product [Prunus armeniaca]
MEAEADVVIVGAGISGLATSLGLHRLGIRSLVLESSDSFEDNRNVTSSRITGLQTFEMSFKAKGKHGDHEIRCVKRTLLLEGLANELPSGTIRFPSKVVSVDESGYFKLVHLADGTILKAKVD